MNLCLCGSADVAGVSSEGDALLMLKNVFHVMNGFLQFHSSYNSGCFVSVLEVSSQIIYSRLCGYTNKIICGAYIWLPQLVALNTSPLKILALFINNNTGLDAYYLFTH